MRSRKSLSQGFTLIELMVVIVILGLLVTLVTPNVMKAVDKGRVATAKAQMNELRGAVTRYRLDKGRLPDSLEEVKDELSGESIPKDPWGNEYKYDKSTKKQFDIICLGADGQEGGEDEMDADIHLADLQKTAAEK